LQEQRLKFSAGKPGNVENEPITVAVLVVVGWSFGDHMDRPHQRLPSGEEIIDTIPNTLDPIQDGARPIHKLARSATHRAAHTLVQFVLDAAQLGSDPHKCWGRSLATTSHSDAIDNVSVTVGYGRRLWLRLRVLLQPIGANLLARSVSGE
jgi:hypothetical protein